MPCSAILPDCFSEVGNAACPLLRLTFLDLWHDLTGSRCQICTFPVLLPGGVSGSRFPRCRRKDKRRSLSSQILDTGVWRWDKISGKTWRDSGFTVGFSERPGWIPMTDPHGSTRVLYQKFCFRCRTSKSYLATKPPPLPWLQRRTKRWMVAYGKPIRTHRCGDQGKNRTAARHLQRFPPGHGGASLPAHGRGCCRPGPGCRGCP